MEVLLKKLRAARRAALDWCVNSYIRLLCLRYAGKTLEVRALTGSVRTHQKGGAYEMTREMRLQEIRTIDGVTFLREGGDFQFFLNASRPETPPADNTRLDLGPLSSQRAARAKTSTRMFNVHTIKTDPVTGVFFVISEA